MTTILQVLSALPVIIKAIVELMTIAEQAFPATGTGADKKVTVMQAIESMIGNDDLWEKVKALFSAVVNTVALFRFGSSGTDPVKK